MHRLYCVHPTEHGCLPCGSEGQGLADAPQAHTRPLSVEAHVQTVGPVPTGYAQVVPRSTDSQPPVGWSARQGPDEPPTDEAMEPGSSPLTAGWHATREGDGGHRADACGAAGTGRVDSRCRQRGGDR